MIIIDRATGLLSSLGVARRLRALVAIGYSPGELAEGLRIPLLELEGLLRQDQPHVSVRRHAAVQRLFAAAWRRPPAGPAADAQRTLARSRRWVGPLAWDDLDDPHEHPNTRGPKRQPGEPRPIDDLAVERASRGEPTKLTRAERLLVVPRLHALRWSDELIAQHLFVSERTILRDRQELDLDAFEYHEIRKARSA